MVGRRRNWGYVNSHPLRLEKKPPDSLIALRELLLHPEHSDILARAILEPTFELVVGSIAASLGIILDGDYDGDKLCDMLCTALKSRGKQNTSPDFRPARLRIDNSRKTVVAELDSQAYLDIPARKLDAWSIFMQEHGCVQCDNTAICKHAGKCLGDDSRAPGSKQEIKRAIQSEN